MRSESTNLWDGLNRSTFTQNWGDFRDRLCLMETGDSRDIHFGCLGHPGPAPHQILARHDSHFLAEI